MKKRTQRHQKLYGPAIASALVSAVVVPTAGWAQTADATVQGTAAANSQITAKNVETGATRRTKADADGNYTLIGLPPVRTASMRARHRANCHADGGVDRDPEPAAQAPVRVRARTLEEVIVTATRLIEVKTSEIGATVSLHQIQTMPQITRNFLEFADTVPGMVFTSIRQRQHLAPGRRTDNSAVNVYIDGVGQKNYVQGRRHHRPDPNKQRQPVPAARHRRIQGHHVELQGRVRPDLERRHHRARRNPAPTSSTAKLSATTPATSCARSRRPRLRGRHEAVVRAGRIRRRLRRADHPGHDAFLLHL